MSVPVEISEVAAAAAEHGPRAFLVSAGADGRPKVVEQWIVFDDVDACTRVGPGTLANVAERPLVTLVWPPASPGAMSLIVDGEARAGSGEGEIRITPTGAVRHRSAPEPDPG